MKLRNKKTGEIIEAVIVDHGAEWEIRNMYTDEHTQTYNSLAKLNEVWEDAPEEPKEYWYIDADGEVLCEPSDNRCEFDNNCREIGNYFETEEEAEQAVEKLKAWKRLKDKGFKFDLLPALGHCDDKRFDISIIGTMPAKWWYNDKVVDDIHYIFGGEE